MCDIDYLERQKIEIVADHIRRCHDTKLSEAEEMLISQLNWQIAERENDMPKTLHLLVTSLCRRNCPHCCNKQYDLNDVPYVTDEELDEVENVYLTGGEPFYYANPYQIALKLRLEHKNIKRI